MKITAIIHKPDGDRELTAVLTEEQYRFLLEYAIADILTKGALLPHVASEEVTIVDLDTSVPQAS